VLVLVLVLVLDRKPLGITDHNGRLTIAGLVQAEKTARQFFAYEYESADTRVWVEGVEGGA